MVIGAEMRVQVLAAGRGTGFLGCTAERGVGCFDRVGNTNLGCWTSGCGWCERDACSNLSTAGEASCAGGTAGVATAGIRTWCIG